MSRLRWPDSTNSVSEKPGTIQQCVPPVVVWAALRIPDAQRQDRRGAVQRLDRTLFIDAEHQRAIRRIEVEPDDFAHLVNEQRILREFEGLDPMRLQPRGPPDPPRVTPLSLQP